MMPSVLMKGGLFASSCASRALDEDIKHPNLPRTLHPSLIFPIAFVRSFPLIMLPKPSIGLGRRWSAFLLVVLLFCVVTAVPIAHTKRADTTGAPDAASGPATLQRSSSAPRIETASDGATALQRSTSAPRLSTGSDAGSLAQPPSSLARTESDVGHSFKTALDSEDWTPPSTPRTPPRYPPGVEGEGWTRLRSVEPSSPASQSEQSAGRGEYPNTSPSSSASSAGEAADIHPEQPVVPAPRFPGMRDGDAPRLMQAQRLPNGALDFQLSGAANANIMRELKQTGTVVVSMEDPASVGGMRLYEYTLGRFGPERTRVPVTTMFLEEVRHLETGAPLAATGGRVTIPRPIVPAEPAATGWRGKLASAREALRKTKDAIAVGLDPRLEHVYTTRGVPAIYGRTDPILGKTIPVEARRLAQEFGEVRVFYDLYRPWDQTKLVYRGGVVRKGELAPESAFKAVVVPREQALPLPKAWQGHEDMAQDALTRIKAMEAGQYAKDVPPRWPSKLRQTLRDRWAAFRTPAAAASPANVGEAARPGFKAAAKGVWDKITASATELKNKVAAWRPSMPSSDLLSAMRPAHL